MLKIKRVKPYLALTHYKSKSKANLFSTIPNPKESDRSSDEFYEEYKLSKVYIIIETDRITFKDDLSTDQKQMLKMGGLGWQEDAGRYTLCSVNLISMPFEIENVGNGAALNTIICFYKKGDSRRGVHIFTLKTGDSAYCHIFCDKQDPSIYGEYVLELTYSDILGNHYSQKYDIEFGLDEHNGRFYNSIDLTGNQKSIVDANQELKIREMRAAAMRPKT